MLTIDNKETHEQLIKRADTELSLLAAEEKEHISRLQSIDAELETLAERGQARNELLTTARATLAQSQQSHSEASTQAKLMEGMMGHADAMEAARMAAHTLTRIGTESAAIEAKCLDEAERDQARAEALTAERLTRSERLRQIGQERIALIHAKDAAHVAIGELEHASIQGEIAEIDREIATTQAVMDTLKQRRSEAIDAGTSRLKPWPEHVADIRAGIPDVQDDVTGTLTRFISYIDGLLENKGRHLAVLQQLPTVRNNLYNWRNIFHISPDDLDLLSSSRDSDVPRTLLRRREIALAVLQEYRAKHRQ